MRKTMVRTWDIGHGRDGTHIYLNETPLPAWAAGRAGEWLAAVTHPVFCCPTWPPLYTVFRWGRLDADGWTEKSAGYQLFRLGNFLNGGFGAWRHSRTVGTVEMTVEWLKDHNIDTGWIEDLIADTEEDCS